MNTIPFSANSQLVWFYITKLHTIGLKTSRHFAIQWEEKAKPIIVTRSRAFSHALRQLVYLLGVLIGWADCLCPVWLGKANYVKMTYHDHVVSSIKARRGEVIIQQMSFKVAKPIEVILNPFPHISKDITKTSFRGWVQVNRLKSRQQHKVEKYSTFHNTITIKFPSIVGVYSLLPRTLKLWPKSVIYPTLFITRPKIWYLSMSVAAQDIIVEGLLFYGLIANDEKLASSKKTYPI